MNDEKFLQRRILGENLTSSNGSGIQEIRMVTIMAII